MEIQSSSSPVENNMHPTVSKINPSTPAANHGYRSCLITLLQQVKTNPKHSTAPVPQDQPPPYTHGLNLEHRTCSISPPCRQCALFATMFKPSFSPPFSFPLRLRFRSQLPQAFLEVSPQRPLAFLSISGGEEFRVLRFREFRPEDNIV